MPPTAVARSSKQRGRRRMVRQWLARLVISLSKLACPLRLTYSSAADFPPENLTSRVAEDLDARLWLRDIVAAGIVC